MASHPTPRELRDHPVPQSPAGAAPGWRHRSRSRRSPSGPAPARARPPRRPRCAATATQILKRLEQRHEETPQALGLSADGGVLEVLVSPEGGWTILVTYPKRPTCIVAVGEAWQLLQLTGGQGA